MGQTLTGDPTVAFTFYDERLRNATTDAVRAEAYLDKADAAASAADTIGILDELLTRYAGATEQAIRDKVAKAYLQKATLLTDFGEKEKVYDQLVAEFADSAFERDRGAVLDALMGKAKIATRKSGKLALLERVIRESKNDTSSFMEYQYTNAMEAKIQLIDDAAEKARLYGQLINEYAGRESSYRFSDILINTAAVIDDKDEKLAIYNRIIRISDENERPAFASTALRKAYKGKIDLAENMDEKIILCDELIHKTQHDRYDWGLIAAMAEKAELTGDTNPLKEYFDKKITAEPDEVEKYKLRIRQAEAMKNREVMEKLISEAQARFEDSGEKKERSLIPQTLSAKLRIAEGDAETLTVSDDAVAYLESHAFDDKSLIPFLEAKARLLPTLQEKIPLYDRIVAIYGKAGDQFSTMGAQRVLEQKAEAILKANL